MITYLPERWIDKITMISLKNKNEISSYNEKAQELHRIQENITQKLCNTLLHLKYHFDDSIIINSFPFEVDSYLSFSSDNLTCDNNTLFQELSFMKKETNKKL